ncbi:TRADD-N-associated membrane domain-containing protein [Paenibacillus alvei]|uniref:TRADD-N-associated membrane domain-containing protein n=1 Tax=Paenibacillus alvei TaxID=44250 RepID=UPI002DDD901E|nr:hypothetical protein [Paenibacillus alvei]
MGKAEIADTKDILNLKLNSFKRLQSHRKRTNIGFIMIFLVLISFIVIELLYGKPLSEGEPVRDWTLAVGVAFALFCLLYPLANHSGEYENEIKNIENDLELLEYTGFSIEQRAEKHFKVHQYDLKRYYDQSLKHSSWIFIVGIVCLVIGFGIIGVSLYMVYTGSNEKSSVVIASLGGVAGLLTNFIGVIYLKMYSETVKSSNEFHNRLVFTHHLHFGNVLLSKIEDKELREHTLSQMALSLVKFEQDNDSKVTSKNEK